MTQNIKTIALAALLACGLPAMAATPIQLKFEGLSLKAYDPVLEKDSIRDVLVDDFYKAGGSSKEVNDGATTVQRSREDLGVVFDGPAIATASSDTLGDGLFTKTRTLITSGGTFTNDSLGTGAIYAGGVSNTGTSFSILTDDVFDTALSFFYSGTLQFDVTITGFNKDGELVILGGDRIPAVTPPSGASCGANRSDISCFWAAASITFAGKANRIDISGSPFTFLLDNITLGSADPRTPIDPTPPPIPEPSTYALMALGLAAVGFAARRRQRRG